LQRGSHRDQIPGHRRGRLEDSDDVQNVYTNVDLSDEVLAALDEE
jgi:hypothetical protein